jgi:arylsulfatase A-like enzyme
LISCVQPFGQWMRARHGAREYRGIRTPRHTYVRDLNGPWLLFDNGQDPYQQHNLAGRPEAAETQRALEAILARKLRQAGDDFLPGPEYLKRWGYAVDATGTVPYK